MSGPPCAHAPAGSDTTHLCRATLSQHFFFSDYEPMRKLALMLRHLPLALRDHYIFAISPADPEDPPVAAALLSFAACYASKYAQACPWVT